MKIDFQYSAIPKEDMAAYRAKVEDALKKLEAGREGFVGWTELPAADHEDLYSRIEKAAEKIQQRCDALIVIGIGGSYLGAKACLEMLQHSFSSLKRAGERQNPSGGTEKMKGVEVFFAGQNLSGTYHAELMEVIENREVCLCVISKSGTTTEPSIAFALLKEKLREKYGDAAKERIFAVTDQAKGTLREEADREGYETFVIPDDVGGRYSVLTPVGLLPIAAAGIDIREIMRGARDSKKICDNPVLDENLCLQYAVARQYLLGKGKEIEVIACYEPKLYYFGEWLKQLYGESEGKDGKGIFPTLMQFTTDLHSMGQFLQDGNQIFFETVLNLISPEKDLAVPDTAPAAFRGKTVNQVNQAAVSGVAKAHASGNVPVIIMEIEELSPYQFGKMVYFFEKSCAVRAYISGVNPFDQPGVEKYKAYMKEALK